MDRTLYYTSFYHHTISISRDLNEFLIFLMMFTFSFFGEKKYFQVWSGCEYCVKDVESTLSIRHRHERKVGLDCP